MLRIVLALYTAFALGANPAAADPALAALLEGDMRKLSFHAEARAVPQVAFHDPDGAEYRLGDWQGRHVLVNFWATWCAPCREEMPALEQLQAEFGGERFEVVTIATGRNSVEGIERFFAEVGVTGLPVLLDNRSALGREMGVMGLPVTVLLDPEGQEIARMLGEADWSGPSARALVTALTGG
ncbi:MAG: TlpA disulfide reductase family protein [Gemmobacter sp.]